MFTKVLLAEDFQDTNLGIVSALKNNLNIKSIQEELYCDKALNRIKLALADNHPFDLLITDLHFKKDHVQSSISNGVALIKAARAMQPNLKVIVNSMVDNPTTINSLFNQEKINGYVCKGRHGLVELIKAVQEVYQNKTYISAQINLKQADNVFELKPFDLAILKDLANGLTKKEISEKLRKQNISPT